MARLSAVIACFLQMVPFLAAAQASETERAGESVSITVGYLSALDGDQTISVQGLTPASASDNIYLGGIGEGPMLWRSAYPVVAVKWLLDSRYQTDGFKGYIATEGFFLYAGLGYSLEAWQAVLRLEVAAGYWWEDITVDYTGFPGLQSFDVGNDEPAWQAGASLAFPFTSRVDARVSGELVSRAEKEVAGSFENGRWYRLETHGTYGTVSIGLTVMLGAR